MTEVSLDAAEKVISFIRASYGTALGALGLTHEEITAVDDFVDGQLIMAQRMVEEKLNG